MGRGTLKIKDDGEKIQKTKFLPYCIQDSFAFGRKAPKDEHDLLPNGINDITNFRVVQQQVNKLSDLKVINGNSRFIRRCNHKVFWFCAFYFHLPLTYPINPTIAQH